MNSLVSIIIPVYNSEEYLCKLFDSIVCQTSSCIEVIIVDDCSSDGSIGICREYCEKNSNFKLYEQPFNMGVSIARNLGLSKANGKYVLFVDSDDWLDRDYVKRMSDAMENKSVDLVVCGMIDVDIDDTKKKVVNDFAILENLNIADEYYRLITLQRMTGPWCKLYKTKIIRNNKILFSKDINWAEDKEFNAKYIACSNSALILDYCGYYYRCGVLGSLSSRVHHDRFSTEYNIWKIKYDDVLRRKIFSDPIIRYLSHELYFIISDYIYSSNNLSYICPQIDKKSLFFLKKNMNKVKKRNALCSFFINNNLIETYKCIRVLFHQR